LKNENKKSKLEKLHQKKWLTLRGHRDVCCLTQTSCYTFIVSSFNEVIHIGIRYAGVRLLLCITSCRLLCYM